MAENVKKKILIFDDDEDILSICSYIFEELGYEVFSFADAENVTERVRTVNPFMIFMDNWLPGGGGVEAVRQIKQSEDFKQIPIVYFSANTDIEMLAANAGADSFLAKPFDLEALETIVRRYI